MALDTSGPTDAHRYVLELLASLPEVPMKDKFELSPVCIARNTGYRDHDHVSKVCRELESADLVRRTESTGTYYVITWRGQAYLAGELELSAEQASTD